MWGAILFSTVIIFVVLVLNVQSLWLTDDGMFYDKELDLLIPYCNPMGGKWNATLHICICYGHYSGSRCEYVSKCLHGQLMNGRCECAYGWQGDLCNRIKCFHGKAITSNECICEKNFGGMYCDSCKERNTKGPPDCISSIYEADYYEVEDGKLKVTYIYLYLLRIIVIFGGFMCLYVLKHTIILLRKRYLENKVETNLDNISIISERAIIKKRVEEIHGIKFPPTYEESEKRNLIYENKNNTYSIPDGVGPPSYEEINVK
uniref:EGF-like domain-containing protein n=1 Tax=Strongyloides stercoralis TaxID=6248 RepID=A0A0K0E830_STRER